MSRRVKKPLPIEITVEGGVINHIGNIPVGQEVIVYDYDTDGSDPDVEKDQDGYLRRRIVFRG